MTRVLTLLAALLAGGCAAPRGASGRGAAAPGPSLREAYAGAFLIGAAINEDQIRGADPRGNAVVEAQFNTITPENAMKWGPLHPAEGVYDFSLADAYVAYGEAHGLFVVGHALVWHEQTGDWVFEHLDGTPLARDELLARMKDHIDTVVGRYRGRVGGWDVVNEALADDGSLRDTPWRGIIGDDYIEQAFRFAHAADPTAELYYNDYAIENPGKRAGAVRLVQGLRDAGAFVTGTGIQAHMTLRWPTPGALDSAIVDLARLGSVMITELDVTVLPGSQDDQSADIRRHEDDTPEMNPFPNGLPADMQQRLADRYAEVFSVLSRRRESVARVTFWGVTDGDSWLNGWPIAGRTNYPLLFDRAGRPKPAFGAAIRAAAAPR